MDADFSETQTPLDEKLKKTFPSMERFFVMLKNVSAA
jgi:hypothetical protein